MKGGQQAKTQAQETRSSMGPEACERKKSLPQATQATEILKDAARSTNPWLLAKTARAVVVATSIDEGQLAKAAGKGWTSLV